MPLKLNIGLTKKIGQPDYGSFGASCHVELELEHGLLENDLVGFHERVRKIFIACRQAVNEELSRQNSHGSVPSQQHGQNVHVPHSTRNNGSVHATSGSSASAKQIEYAQQLAGQIRGLGVRRLEVLSQKMCQKPLAALTSLEASSVIDVLKDVKRGRIGVGAVLNGSAA